MKGKVKGKSGPDCLTISVVTFGVLAVLFCIGMAVGNYKSENVKTNAAQISKVSEISVPLEAESSANLKAYSAKLSSGHYTSGIDFPAGTYTITASKGHGNVYSSNSIDGGLNEIMGTGKDDTSEFKDAELPAGEILSISDVTVKIKSDAADVDSVVSRDNPVKKQVTLSSGNYIAGTDFEAGTYIIKATDGTGNVYSDSTDRGINAIMSTKSDESYIKEFKNVLLDEGTKLTISDVTVRLTPSK